MLSTVAKTTQARYGTISRPAQRSMLRKASVVTTTPTSSTTMVATRGADLLQAEEHHGPAQRERELQGEQRQRPAPRIAIGGAPHAPGGNRHQHVEDRPHRAEQAVGRREGRLGEIGVPGVDAGRHDRRAKRTDDEAERHEERQHDQVDQAVARHGQLSRLAPTLMVSASTAVLKAKETMPCTMVRWRMARETVATSAVCDAQPMTKE